MTIPYRIVIGSSLSLQQRHQAQEQFQNVFQRINGIYNNWNPNSEISRINQAPDATPISLSSELFTFLTQLDKLHEETEGRFDPALGASKQLWLLYLKYHQLPPGEEQKNCQGGWKWVILNSQNQSLTKAQPLHLDLCGVVKGYAVDQLLTICQKFSINCYVEWGGEIKTSGHHPSGRHWKIYSTAARSSMNLHNQAIATSGTHYQKWAIDGKLYSHILDPHSKTPLELSTHPIQAVSVIHEECAYADAMATALMTFASKQEAEDWAKAHNLIAYIQD